MRRNLRPAAALACDRDRASSIRMRLTRSPCREGFLPSCPDRSSDPRTRRNQSIVDEIATAWQRRHCQAVARQPFRESFTALAGEKVSFFDAAILIFSPFDGLRPSRSGESLVLNFPNPGNETSSPATAALTMLCSMSSRIARACVFVTLWAAAVFAISSAEFISEVPRESKGGSIARCRSPVTQVAAPQVAAACLKAPAHRLSPALPYTRKS